MTTLDWLIVALFIAATVAVGLIYARRASKSVADFFVGGRSIPWWLAGTSILSTSFASDTPLHTTRAIREGGLSAAWFYWNGIIFGVIIAFVFAKLWRRAGVLTDNEFVELRYTGKPAAALRGGLAIFKAFFLEIITMAWVTLGMVKIVKAIMDLPDHVSVFGMFHVQAEVLVVAVLLVATIIFSASSGFWGVVTTDLIEFVVALGGAIVLAVIAMQRVGGPVGLREGLREHAAMGEAALDFTPDLVAGGGMVAFGVYLGVQWWARDGSDGGGQRSQRLVACKDEKNAVAAGVWSLAVTWLIRSWPWYLVALCSLVIFPDLADHESAYPMMIKELMPVGLKGLMVAAFFAAFMGTMDSHYNLTASYAVNDVYKRFMVKGKTENHYVSVSRWMTLFVALVAAIGALLLPSVLGALRFKMELVAGVGLIYMVRWFWWRVNATSELVTLVVSVVAALSLNVLLVAPEGEGALYSAIRLVLVVTLSVLAMIATVFLTKPEPREHLIAFYRKVRPPARFWGPVAREAGPVGDSGIGWDTLAQASLALVFIFAGMIGLGKALLGDYWTGAGLILLAAATGVVSLRWVFSKPSPEEGEAAAAAAILAGPGPAAESTAGSERLSG